MQENPGSSPLKNREFIDRAKKLSAQFNMIYNDKQQTISSLKKNEFNAEVLNHYYFNNQIKYNKYATIRLFECTNVISKDDIKEIKQKLVDCTLDEHTDLNFKTIMIIEYLVSKNNSDAIAFKELYIT